MKEILRIPEERDGFVIVGDPRPMTWPHRHDELELNLVLRGTAAYLLGDTRYDLRRHGLVWLFPGQEHLFLSCSEDYCAYVLVFKPQLLAQTCRTPGSETLRQSDPAGHFCKPLPAEKAAVLGELFARIAEGSDPELFNAGLGYALLLAWDAYLTTAEAASGTALHPAVEQVVRWLQEEMEPETVEALARRVGLSESHLSRLFGQQMGLSVTDFRNTKRMERFLRLLQTQPKLNLGQAALEAGFGSYAQFYCVFLQHMGCSPAAYRADPNGQRSRTGQRPQAGF